MADVKVPALLHKMSKVAQKAWYKKNNMKMPDDMEGRSAAAAKKVKVTPRKEIAVEPGSVRALNAARQQAYMAKGGRQPIGAAGSGGHSSMAGSNMSTAKGMIAGIKAGFNPKVSLDPYESERAKKVGPRSLKMKKEEVELDEANMRFDYEAAARPKSSDVKNFLNRDKNPRAAAASKKYIRRMTKLGGLGPNQTKKDTEAHMKAHFEEVEQVDEQSPAEIKAKYYHDQFDKVKPVKAYDKEGKLVGRYRSMDHAKQMKPGHTYKVEEEVEQIEEVTKKEAEALLGGPVKAKPKMPPGKQPAGYRYVRGLARKAMKASMKKEEVELEEGKVAKALAVGAMSLASMGAKAHTDTTKSVAQLAAERPALAQRLKDIGATGQVPASDKRAAELQKKQDQEMPASERRAKEIEKMKKEEVVQTDEAAKDWKKAFGSVAQKNLQKDIGKMRSKVSRLKYVGADPKVDMSQKVTAQKTQKGMYSEEAQYIEEKLTAADPASKWISDFVASDNPKFAGKSKKERINMALGAYYATKRNEEVEVVDEKVEIFHRQGPGADMERYHKDTSNPAAVLARKKAADAARTSRVAGDLKAKKMGQTMSTGNGGAVKAVSTTSQGFKKEEVEQVEEVTGYEGVKDRKDIIKRAAAMNRMGKDTFLTRVTARAAEMKKEKAAKTVKKLGEGMDAVGREDKDIDNDGDSDKTDVYLHNKRKAIGNAIRKKLTSKLEKKDGE